MENNVLYQFCEQHDCARLQYVKDLRIYYDELYQRDDLTNAHFFQYYRNRMWIHNGCLGRGVMIPVSDCIMSDILVKFSRDNGEAAVGFRHENEEN